MSIDHLPVVGIPLGGVGERFVCLADGYKVFGHLWSRSVWMMCP
jgi:hypothetical protein